MCTGHSGHSGSESSGKFAHLQHLRTAATSRGQVPPAVPHVALAKESLRAGLAQMPNRQSLIAFSGSVLSTRRQGCATKSKEMSAATVVPLRS